MHVLGPQGTYLCAVAFHPQVPHLQIQLTTQWIYSKKGKISKVPKTNLKFAHLMATSFIAFTLYQVLLVIQRWLKLYRECCRLYANLHHCTQEDLSIHRICYPRGSWETSPGPWERTQPTPIRLPLALMLFFFFFFFALLFSSILLLSCSVLPTFKNTKSLLEEDQNINEEQFWFYRMRSSYYSQCILFS